SLTTSSAPSCRSSGALSFECVIATTSKPAALAYWTARWPSPPMPTTTTRSCGRGSASRRPRMRTACGRARGRASRALPTGRRPREQPRLSSRNPFHGIDVRLTDPVDSRGGHALPRGGERAVEIDAAHAVLHHEDLEALPARVEGRVLHAEVGGEAGEEEPPAAALPQAAGQTGGGPMIVLVERGVGIDG